MRTAQVIVAQDVTPMAADVGQLLPLVTAIGRTLRQRPRQVLADAGLLLGGEPAGAGATRGSTAYIATGRQKHDRVAGPGPARTAARRR